MYTTHTPICSQTCTEREETVSGREMRNEGEKSRERQHRWCFSCIPKTFLMYIIHTCSQARTDQERVSVAITRGREQELSATPAQTNLSSIHYSHTSFIHPHFHCYVREIEPGDGVSTHTNTPTIVFCSHTQSRRERKPCRDPNLVRDHR